jgi:hypothetical protein
MKATPSSRQIIVRRGEAPRSRAIRERRTLLLAVATWALFCEAPADAGETLVCEREMTRAARQYDIPLNVLFAVGLTETGARGVLSPYDINVNARSMHSENLEEALLRVAEQQARGASLIDIGCMQINYHWHGKNFTSLRAMFDPGLNVSYAAKLLKDLKQREGSWTLAVARYNAGPNNNPAQKKYVCAVMRNMVASGFGAWTINARQFCGLPMEGAENTR